MAQKLTVIDLFCGAGGLSLGFEQAGFSPLLGVDADERALNSYAANFPQSATLLADIPDVSRTEMLVAADAVTATVVVGGPPCSGFSAGGRRRPDDVRNDLIMAFARAVAEVRPDYFVLENVPGLLDAHAATARDGFAAFMKKAGYRVLTPWLLNAADYEVPQERWRVFVVGHRDGVSAPTPPAPRPIASPRGRPSAISRSSTASPPTAPPRASPDRPSPPTPRPCAGRFALSATAPPSAHALRS